MCKKIIKSPKKQKNRCRRLTLLKCLGAVVLAHPDRALSHDLVRSAGTVADPTLIGSSILSLSKLKRSKTQHENLDICNPSHKNKPWSQFLFIFKSRMLGFWTGEAVKQGGGTSFFSVVEFLSSNFHLCARKINLAILALKDISWVAIYCKERDLTVTGIKKHENDMKRVVECLNRKKNTPDIQPFSSCRRHVSKKKTCFLWSKKRKCVGPETTHKSRGICDR